MLEAVAENSGGVGVTEVASLTGLDKGTTSRLLATLRELGYVYQREADRQYELGSRCLWLSREYSVGIEELSIRAAPFLAELRDATRETVHLAIREGIYMVFVAQYEPDRQVRVQSAVGSRLALHRTAMGRAILAEMPGSDRQRLFGLLRSHAAATGEEIDFDAVTHDVEEATKRGWAAVDRHDDVTRIAAAVRGPRSAPAAAITVSGPSYRMTDRVDEIGRTMRLTAERVGEALAARE